MLTQVEETAATIAPADAGFRYQNKATPRRKRKARARAKSKAQAEPEAQIDDATRPKRKYENKPRPPSPLPVFVKFNDIKAAGIATNYCALSILIDQHGFPPGVWFGSATHVWRLDEVEAWLAARPSKQPKRSLADDDDGDQRRGR